MGHIHLGAIPRTKPWNEVVGLLEVGADVEEVAEASARAAERALLSASVDPVFVEAVRLLISMPIAARSEDFGDALRRLDLDVGTSPGFLDVMLSASRHLDRLSEKSGARTDFTEDAVACRFYDLTTSTDRSSRVEVIRSQMVGKTSKRFGGSG